MKQSTKPEKAYKCSACGESFTTEEALRQHEQYCPSVHDRDTNPDISNKGKNR